MAPPAFVYERAVTVPMRDGTGLDAIVFRPMTGTAPTLFVMTPYGAASPQTGMAGNGAAVPHATVLVDAGFAVVWVEARGTFGSEGEFTPQVNDARDGYDALDWIVSQPWSNGTVGMYGASYLGMTQWAAAAGGHPALAAIAPMQTTMRWYEGFWYHPGGALSLSAVTTWHALMSLNDELRALGRGGGDLRRVMALSTALGDGLSLNDHTPIAVHPLLAGAGSFDEFVARPDHGEFWEARDFSRDIPQMSPPALMTAGWYDLFIGQQLRDFELYRDTAGSAEAREGSRLIVGPWDHEPTLAGHFSDHDFGNRASAFATDLTGEHIRHFRRWLTPSDAAPRGPSSRVKLFVMGVDEWRDFEDWPPPEARPVEFFLAAEDGDSDDGGLRSGTLITRPPTSGRTWEYTYVPSDPVPTTGGAQIPPAWGFTGPTDQRALDDRSDIVSFQTEPLPTDTGVIGYVRATLFVRSDALDTDFTAKLIDVHPDGRAALLCDGILRMRYRTSLRHPQLMEPGRTYEIDIDMAATANVFQQGHRIRLDVSSSNFPRFDRNTNTGGIIDQESIDKAVVARNAVLTGPEHPSRLVLNVVGSPEHGQGTT
ncbi:CocE/NonD family hydrolase [Streptomyces sp. NPDC050263]|uniref:CocE/NonD family hydrolase n=1 Tax=Streptomyces sp. NPDC050263 TaxID=3155037 RepID=UPI00341C9C64